MASDARSVCPACGGGFGCGAGTGRCWCARIAVPDELLRELAARYDGCLCPGCLARLAPTSTSAPRAGFLGPRPT